MKTKKNPNKDVNRWISVFFQLGLILILFISWRALEARTYKSDDDGQPAHYIIYDDIVEEAIHTFETPKPKQPEVKKVKVNKPADIILIDESKVKDEDDFDDFVESWTDAGDSTDNISMVDVSTLAGTAETPVEIIEMPLDMVQDAPVFPGCESYKTNQERKVCLNEKIAQFIDRRFNTDLAQDLGLSGINRIKVQFTIDENGKVSNVLTRSTESSLEDEAQRVIELLPDMIPGKYNDKEIRVIYRLPIVFKID